jgi:hypothetical protein
MAILACRFRLDECDPELHRQWDDFDGMSEEGMAIRCQGGLEAGSVVPPADAAGEPCYIRCDFDVDSLHFVG